MLKKQLSMHETVVFLCELMVWLSKAQNEIYKVLNDIKVICIPKPENDTYFQKL